MGDAGSMSVLAQDTLTGAGVQTVTGAKTFNNQTLAFRNPANTFTGTLLDPPYASNVNVQMGQNSEAIYIVYVDQVTGNYTAKDARMMSVQVNSTVAETAIQSALTAASNYGTVIIRDGTYTLSGAFTGFTFLYNQKIIMGRGCNIRVPNGYTGKVFKLVDTTSSHTHFQGGLIDEVGGTPSKLWTCFDLNSTTTTGLLDIRISNTRIVNAAVGIDLRTDTNGWCNACIFDNVYCDLGKIGVQWTHTGVYTDGQSGSNQNTFLGLVHQATTGTTNGFKDVNGRRNAFINCYPADFTGAMITCNITANARDTVILGGSTTYLNFADLEPAGFQALIKDAYQGDIAYNRKTTGYEDGIAVSAPSSPSTGTVRSYTKTLDANNDGRFSKLRVNGAVVEVQTA